MEKHVNGAERRLQRLRLQPVARRSPPTRTCTALSMGRLNTALLVTGAGGPGGGRRRKLERSAAGGPALERV